MYVSLRHSHTPELICHFEDSTYGVVHEMRHVSIETSVNGEVTVVHVVIIQIKQIRHPLCVIFLSTTLRLLRCNNLMSIRNTMC